MTMKLRGWVLTGLLAGFLVPCVRGAEPLKIKTDKGPVEGSLTTDGKVRAFKGIPYAAPPVGELRWREPQPAVAWKEVRETTQFGSHCIQSSSYNDMVFHDSGASEDCLTLNVWTPADTKPGSLPVMVWIYGGGFTTGGTSENRQDGQFLAHRGVVVVSMNYRLGIFGFFAHPELTAESPHHASGNYGLMDQAAALRWVQRNIAGFGGDPKNVTLFGESAGSSSVSTQMASPLTKGLITKAIGESGAPFGASGPSLSSLSQTETRDSEFAEKAFGTSKVAELRKVPMEDVLRAATAKTTPPVPRFGPDVDGYFLPDSVPNIYAAGKQAHIPMMAGWNSDEGRGTVIGAKVQPTAASFLADAQTMYGEKAPQFLAAYAATTDAEAVTSAGDLAGDRFIAYATWRWIEAQVKTGGAPVYRYYFDLGSPGDANHAAALGAFHSDDIEYVFGTLDSRPGITVRAEDRMLSDQMGQYWTNFAKTGDPNGGDLPKWGTYHGPEWTVMRLDATPASIPDPHRDRYVFLEANGIKPAPASAN